VAGVMAAKQRMAPAALRMTRWRKKPVSGVNISGAGGERCCRHDRYQAWRAAPLLAAGAAAGGHGGWAQAAAAGGEGIEQCLSVKKY